MRGAQFYYGKGCDACHHTGYQGRTAIYELLPMTDEIRQMVMDRVPASLLKKAAVEGGMRTLRTDGLSKVASGETSAEEVMRVTQLDVS